MLCSNCGYENPSEHRYCGMCGTPFPYRALTVPEYGLPELERDLVDFLRKE